MDNRLRRVSLGSRITVGVAETTPTMDHRPASAPHRHSRRIALAALVLLTSGPLASRPSLQSVRLVAGDGATSVVLVADGALPSPKIGVLTDPPRIYLDFPDVAAATAGTRADGDLLVRGVRVAVNQSQPLVTRVVIDLARPAPHRIEAGLRDSGQLTIVVGGPVAPAGAAPPRPRSQDAQGTLRPFPGLLRRSLRKAPLQPRRRRPRPPWLPQRRRPERCLPHPGRRCRRSASSTSETARRRSSSPPMARCRRRRLAF